MTKEEFRKRWDGSSDGGGITWDDVAKCAVEWGLFSKPKIHPLDVVGHAVTIAAGCKDVFPLYNED